jgi:hypothetical protein
LDDDSDFLPYQPLVLVDGDVGLQIADIQQAYKAVTGQDMPGLPRIFIAFPEILDVGALAPEREPSATGSDHESPDE